LSSSTSSASSARASSADSIDSAQSVLNAVNCPIRRTARVVLMIRFSLLFVPKTKTPLRCVASSDVTSGVAAGPAMDLGQSQGARH
jgi:hypothetical protein